METTGTGRPPAFSAYLVINTVTGKRYVGITTKTVAARWRRHVNDRFCRRSSRLIAKALCKYGPQAFEVEHIACARTVDELKALERLLIQQHQTLAPMGYNLTGGGDGMHAPAPTLREELRARAIGHRFRSAADRDKAGARSGPENPFYGRRHSLESLAAMSAAKRGKVQSLETRAKRGASLKGIVFTEERRQRISAAKKGKPRRDREKLAEMCRNLGQAQKGRKKGTPSAETRAKISAALKANWYMSPETRSKISVTMRGRQLSEEHRTKLAENCKRNALNRRKMVPGPLQLELPSTT